MAIKKEKLHANFTLIPNSILRDSQLPLDTIPLWQDSWHYLIFNQLGGSGVDSASLFR